MIPESSHHLEDLSTFFAFQSKTQGVGGPKLLTAIVLVWPESSFGFFFNIFSVRCYRKIQTNFLAKPIFIGMQAENVVLFIATLTIHWKIDVEAEAPILWPPDADS